MATLDETNTLLSKKVISNTDENTISKTTSDSRLKEDADTKTDETAEFESVAVANRNDDDDDDVTVAFTSDLDDSVGTEENENGEATEVVVVMKNDDDDDDSNEAAAIVTGKENEGIAGFPPAKARRKKTFLNIDKNKRYIICPHPNCGMVKTIPASYKRPVKFSQSGNIACNFFGPGHLRNQSCWKHMRSHCKKDHGFKETDYPPFLTRKNDIYNNKKSASGQVNWAVYKDKKNRVMSF